MEKIEVLSVKPLKIRTTITTTLKDVGSPWLGRDVHKMAIFFFSGVKILCVPVHAWIELIDRIISEHIRMKDRKK